MYQSLHPGMGEAVLQRLSQLADLAELTAEGVHVDGIIAGQAVASAVSELFYSGVGVIYNDVDAFVFTRKFEKNTRQALATASANTVVLDNQYGHVILSSFRVYDINSTSRKGMLNTVHCRVQGDAWYLPANIFAQKFLNSFDLNCVQVGVRLADKQLVWTPAFEQFLQNQEMLVMNIKTPAHTAIRWFKKKQELAGVFGHDEKTMELLVTAMVRHQNSITDEMAGISQPSAMRKIQRLQEAGLLFGKGYTNKALDVWSDLGTYFNLKEVPNRGIPVCTLESKGGEIADIVDKRCSPLIIPSIVRAHQGHWRKHICKFVLEGFEHSDMWVYQAMAVHGVDSVVSQVSEKDIRDLTKFYETHLGLRHELKAENPSKQVQIMKSLTALSQKKGHWVFGVFEEGVDIYNRHAYAKPLWSRLDGVDDSKFHEIIAELFQDITKVLLDMPDVVPSSHRMPSKDIDQYFVSELTTFQQLYEEGTQMHHCVAGYVGQVKAGHSRIFQLRHPQRSKSLTIELRKSLLSNGWRCVQARGLQNREATDFEMRTVSKLVQAINLYVFLNSGRLTVSWHNVERLESQLPMFGKLLMAATDLPSKIRAKLTNIKRGPLYRKYLSRKKGVSLDWLEAARRSLHSVTAEDSIHTVDSEYKQLLDSVFVSPDIDCPGIEERVPIDSDNVQGISDSLAVTASELADSAMSEPPLLVSLEEVSLSGEDSSIMAESIEVLTTLEDFGDDLRVEDVTGCFA